jgi:hypothetical protein
LNREYIEIAKQRIQDQGGLFTDLEIEWTVGMGRQLLTVWVNLNGRYIPSHIQDLNKYKYRLGGIYLFRERMWKTSIGG